MSKPARRSNRETAACGFRQSWALPRCEVHEFELPPSYRMDAHAHQHDGVILVVDGAFELGAWGKEHVLPQGSIYPMPCDVEHQESVGSVRTTCLLLYPKEDLSGIVADLLRERGSWLDRSITTIAASATSALRAGSPIASSAARVVFDGLAASVCASGSTAPPLWLLRAWSAIETGYRALRVGAVAARVGVSREHLSRTFVTTFGLSITDYVRVRRLEYCAHRLATHDDSLSSIAHSAGFADQGHFTRSFHTYFGITPARFRQESRKD